MEKNMTLREQLRTKQAALASLCSFKVPQSMCDEEELFYRRQHRKLGNDMRNLSEGEDK